MMALGMPCTLMIASINFLATILAIYGRVKAMKCVDLRSLSTTTIMEFFQFELGNPSRKLQCHPIDGSQWEAAEEGL